MVSMKFICQLGAKNVQGRRTQILRYTREQLSISAFQVWYKLKVATHSQLEAWKDKRMTGLRMSWRAENRPMILTSSKVGRTVETPFLKESVFEKDQFSKHRSYKVFLQFPENHKVQIENRKLVIRLESEMREEEG